MTIHQTDNMRWGNFGFNNRFAGQVETHLVTYTVAALYDQSEGDIIEMLALPAMARLVDVEYETTALSVGNISFGFMSGKPGTRDASRTCDAVIFAAADRTATNGRRLDPVELATAALAVNQDNHRSIGCEMSADETAGAKTISLKVSYVR